jgi:TDG/mug DNA glycosylase family protein
MGAYRRAFDRPAAAPGLQPEQLGSSRLWLLPNPSGAQGRYQLPELSDQFRQLRIFAAHLEAR